MFRHLSTLSRIQCAKILGIHQTASALEAKAAFVIKAKLVHPDVSAKPPTEAKADFVQLVKAYQTFTGPATSERSSQGPNTTGREEDSDFREFQESQRRRRRNGAQDSERGAGGAAASASGWDSDELNFFKPGWWASLRTELGDSLDFAYWGPAWDDATAFPDAFELEERTDGAHPHIVEVKSKARS